MTKVAYWRPLLFYIEEVRGIVLQPAGGWHYDKLQRDAARMRGTVFKFALREPIGYPEFK